MPVVAACSTGEMSGRKTKAVSTPVGSGRLKTAGRARPPRSMAAASSLWSPKARESFRRGQGSATLALLRSPDDGDHAGQVVQIGIVEVERDCCRGVQHRRDCERGIAGDVGASGTSSRRASWSARGCRPTLPLPVRPAVASAAPAGFRGWPDSCVKAEQGGGRAFSLRRDLGRDNESRLDPRGSETAERGGASAGRIDVPMRLKAGGGRRGGAPAGAPRRWRPTRRATPPAARRARW